MTAPVRVKGPYLDVRDLWVGVFWRRERGGLRVYWCPLPAVVIRVDMGVAE